jgi:hypothetical protein
MLLPFTVPGIDQLGTRRIARVGTMDEPGVGIAPNRLARSAGREFTRCIALPVLLLAPNIHDFDGAMPLGRGAERRTCLNRLELLRIADQHDLGTVPLGFGHHALKLTRANHARLVDDEDMFVSQHLPAIRPLMLKAHKRALGEAAGGAACARRCA